MRKTTIIGIEEVRKKLLNYEIKKKQRIDYYNRIKKKGLCTKCRSRKARKGHVECYHCWKSQQKTRLPKNRRK